MQMIKKLLNIWLWLFIMSIIIIFVSIIAPYVRDLISEIFSELDRVSHGIASPLLLLLFSLLITIFIVALGYYFLKFIEDLLVKPSTIHIMTSTMHTSMIFKKVEENARKIIVMLASFHYPHILLISPTDKNVDLRVKKVMSKEEVREK